MHVIGDIHHPLNANVGDIKKTQIKWGGSWMAKAETNLSQGLQKYVDNECTQ